MTNLFTGLRGKSVTERILFALSALLFLFVTPFTVIRFVSQEWPVFFLDLFLVACSAFIFYNTVKGRYLNFLKFFMCCLVTIGASLTVIIGGIEHVYWIYPTVLTAYFLVKHDWAFLFVIAVSVAISPTVLSAAEGMHVLTIYLSLFGTASFISAFAQEVTLENESLSSLAATDPLTEVGNRRLFVEEATKCMNNSKMDNAIYAMIVIDIDDFKVINDTHGHKIGDLILRHLCTTISKRFANHACMYRLGGEEFCIILPGDNPYDGVNFAELVKFVLANEHDKALPAYTVSMGVANLKADESIDEWLHRADVAMYSAKEIGKDTIVKAEDIENDTPTTGVEHRRSSRATERH